MALVGGWWDEEGSEQEGVKKNRRTDAEYNRDRAPMAQRVVLELALQDLDELAGVLGGRDLGCEVFELPQCAVGRKGVSARLWAGRRPIRWKLYSDAPTSYLG